MNSTTEYRLWQIKMSIANKGFMLDDAEKIVAPIVWWVTTGRCTGGHVRVINNLNSRQIKTIARRLISKGFGDYQIAIDSVAEYLEHIGA